MLYVESCRNCLGVTGSCNNERVFHKMPGNNFQCCSYLFILMEDLNAKGNLLVSDKYILLLPTNLLMEF